MATSSLFDVVLSTEDRISKAKIKLFKENPFFSYLIEHLRFIPTEHLPTMGVDEKGRLYYNSKFVESLTDNQLKGVLAHEVLHPSLRHFSRGKGRDILVNGMMLVNIAMDISVNQLLVENQFELPATGLIPQDNQVTVFNEITIEKINEKCFEEIYEELKVDLKKMIKQGKAKMVGQSGGKGTDEDMEAPNQPGTFDEHIVTGDEEKDGKDGKGKDGKGKDGKEDEDKFPNWNSVVAEAYNHAKMIGKHPAGFGRMFDDLHKSKVNWRAILRRAVASMIPYDHTYCRPNKKYIGYDIYVPSIHGESIKVLCSIDTSGSIGQSELNDFVSEIIGIARSFASVEFHILTHDTEVHDDIPVYNGHINKIKSMKIHGGGGTSHIPLYEYIEKKKLGRDTKLLVSFTDGYSCYPDKKPNCPTVFVLSGNHCKKEDMPKWGHTIILE